MSTVILIYTGAAMTILWGIGHLFHTKNVVKGFWGISEDNKKILFMEWINEGATLIFIGVLTIGVSLTEPAGRGSEFVYILSIIMLVALAVISLFTGFRVNFLPYKLCPIIFTSSAVMIFLGMTL
jgi:hypothetical protein